MKANHSRGKLGGVSTLAILAALLFANVLCVMPQLHGKIHNPCANHECAVTLSAAGNYEVNNAPPLVPAPQPLVEFTAAVALPSVSVPTLFLRASIFEHAPPVAS
jgi:hypothetical protein